MPSPTHTRACRLPFLSAPHPRAILLPWAPTATRSQCPHPDSLPTLLQGWLHFPQTPVATPGVTGNMKASHNELTRASSCLGCT